MTIEELKAEMKQFSKPSNWREGQYVFNYIDQKYGVARTVQFIDHVDCFYRDEMIDEFVGKAVERINELEERKLLQENNQMLKKICD
jgi:hypothetical protein